MPLRVLNRIYREKEPKEEKVRKEIATLRDSLHESPLKRKLSKWVETLDTEPAKARAKKVPQETLGYGLDQFVTNEPEKPKEPAPLTHLKVGDKVEVDIMDHSKLGDYATVIKVDGDLVTISGEGIQPPKYVRGFTPPGATKTYDERHFLEVGFGIDYGGGVDLGGERRGEPKEDYLFHFRFTPPQDILAFGLRPKTHDNGEIWPFHYYAPAAEFHDKLPAFVDKLREHHYYQPHGIDFYEVMRGEDAYSKYRLPRKAWELEPVYQQDNVGTPRIHDEWGVRYVPAEKRSGLRPTVFTYPDRQSAMNGKQFHDRHIDPREWEPGVVEPLSRKGQAAVGIAREMDLNLGPGRYRRGEWVYTCTKCGREGEQEWMKEHLKSAHKVGDARTMESILRVLPKRREYANVRAEELEQPGIYTPETKELLKGGKGYRCSGYSGRSGYSGHDGRPVRVVLEQEVFDQGNTDMIGEMRSALAIKTPLLGDETDKDLVEEAIQEVEKRFGKDAVAVWFGLRPYVKSYYCGGEEPEAYRIPKSALVISDLGDNGALFVMPRRDAVKVGIV